MISNGGGCGGHGKGSSTAATSSRGGGGGGGGGGREQSHHHHQQQQQLSLLEVLLSALRKSMVSCRVDRQEEQISAVRSLEIGWPTNVQHVTHVTFDRFHGFLGLPVEFQVEIPCRVPSARYFSFSFFFLVFSLSRQFSKSCL